MLPRRLGVFLAITQPHVPHKGPPGWALGSSSERESRGLDLKVPFEPFKSLTCAGVCVLGGGVCPRHLTARNVAQFGILRAVCASAGSLGSRPPVCLQKGGSPEGRPPSPGRHCCSRSSQKTRALREWFSDLAPWQILGPQKERNSGQLPFLRTTWEVLCERIPRVPCPASTGI